MAVKWYANLDNSDITPNWLELTSADMIHFTGAGTIAGQPMPNIRPFDAYVWNEELWVGSNVLVGGQQVNSYKKPSSSVQRGKVLKVQFTNEDLVSAPFLSVYDDPTFATWEKEVCSGTEQTEWTGLLKAYITGSEANNNPPGIGWAVKETGSPGNANPNALAGSSYFATVPFIPAVGGDFTFTIALAVPFDCSYGKEDKFDPKIVVTFVVV